MAYTPPTKRNHMWSQVPPLITRTRQDGEGFLLSRFRSLLEGDITEASTVTLRYVRIVVLNFLLLTTVTVTGERATSASLTLAMPRGPWLQTSRYRKDLSKSRSHTKCQRAIPDSLIIPKDMMVDTSNPKRWEVKPVPSRRWWSYLIRG